VALVLSARSGFQLATPYFVPRCETREGFCGSWALLPAAWGRFAAGGLSCYWTGEPFRGGPSQWRSGAAELGLAWLFCALALTSCVSPEELLREHEATGVGYGFHPGTDAFANLASTGELGAACPDFLPATAVVGVIGDIGAVWRALLPLAVRVCARADRASPQPRASLGNPVRPVFSATATALPIGNILLSPTFHTKVPLNKRRKR